MRWEREQGFSTLRKKGEQGWGPLEAEEEWVPDAGLRGSTPYREHAALTQGESSRRSVPGPKPPGIRHEQHPRVGQ